MLTLGDIIQATIGTETKGLPGSERPIRDVVIDSRQAGPDCLFVGLKGESVDGSDFADDAIAKGAAAVIVSRAPAGAAQVWTRDAAAASITPPVAIVVPDTLWALQELAAYWRRRMTVRVVGVTGSVGKTVTKELTASVLSRRYVTLRNEGNLNNEIGLPLTLLKVTPKTEYAVLEMGMYALGEIARLAEIALPSVGVVTNVEPVHLERLGTIERIAQAKSELVQALPADGVAVLNGDDPRVRAMAALTKARVFTYGLTPDCDLYATDIESQGLEGIRFRLHYRGEAIHARAALLGTHSVHTALAAAAVALNEGLSWQEIMAGLMDVSAQLRLIATPAIRGALILDDTYNASPKSTIAALNLLAELKGRRIAVLGDMLELGALEDEGHRKVARRAIEVVSRLITVGKRGRIIGEEALACGMSPENVVIVDTNQDAIRILSEWIQEGDIILVKGSRGMHMEDIVKALRAS
ncbi:MAG: UDP-N-acetylmuramoyl-tripeptide--D-alanyl-D-alanine ligase [Anaerolineales bacterium]